jgi:ribonuclease HII
MARTKTPSKKRAPKLSIEREYWEAGYKTVVGMDEVGRGSWAGPLVVGAAVLPDDRRVYGVRDSKMLTEDRREELFDRLTEWCVAWSIGIVSYNECDFYGMADAQRIAAKRALDGLGLEPDRIVLDGKWNFVGGENVDCLVKADAKCLSVATASIIAKVLRDRMMRDVAPEYPEYNFANNKGYPCPIHKKALLEWGMSPIHRHSWGFMHTLLSQENEQMELLDAEA